jgi:excisionase family DNA binding protein
VTSKPDSILSVAQCAERLGVTRARVNQLIESKRLPAQKVGRSYIVFEKDLKLVKERKVGRPSKN